MSCGKIHTHTNKHLFRRETIVRILPDSHDKSLLSVASKALHLEDCVHRILCMGMRISSEATGMLALHQHHHILIEPNRMNEEQIALIDVHSSIEINFFNIL